MIFIYGLAACVYKYRCNILVSCAELLYPRLLFFLLSSDFVFYFAVLLILFESFYFPYVFLVKELVERQFSFGYSRSAEWKRISWFCFSFAEFGLVHSLPSAFDHCKPLGGLVSIKYILVFCSAHLGCRKSFQVDDLRHFAIPSRWRNLWKQDYRCLFLAWSTNNDCLNFESHSFNGV